MKKTLCVMMAVFVFCSAFLIMPTRAAYENTYTNTGNQAEDIIGVARTQIGYKEGPSASQMDGDTYAGDCNYTKYGQWYGLNPAAWCAMFISWCANQAGIPASVIPKHASCDVGMNWFKNRNQWGWGVYWGNRQGKTVYTPVRGDIVFYGKGDLSDSSHVGIVYAVDAAYIYTIEGNTTNQVAYKQHPIGDSYIYGYGHPAYTGGSGSGGTEPFGPSTLSLSAYTYPTALSVGASFRITGTLASNYPITWVRAAAYDNSGKIASSSYKTPGTYAFDILEINATMRFGILAAGRYVYCIEAKDSSGAYKMLLMQPFTVGETSQSQTVFSYRVNTDGSPLNVRSGPGVSYDRVGSLPDGADINVRKIQDGWAYTTYNGVSGWASMEYLKINYTPMNVVEATPKPTASPTPSPTNKPTASPSPTPAATPDVDSTLSVREASYPTSLSVGASFRIVGTVTSNYTITWVRAAVYNNAGAVSVSAEKMPKSKSFNLLEINPDIRFGILSAGRYVYCVEAKDESGTYKMLLMQPFTVGSTSQTQTTFPYTVNTSDAPLNVRSGPGITYEKVGTLPKGAVIRVQKIQDGWAYTAYSDVSGWASMEYLQIAYTPVLVTYSQIFAQTADSAYTLQSEVITNISEKTSPEEFLLCFANRNRLSVSLTEAYVGTGYEITDTVSGAVLHAVISGDIDGDGLIRTADYIKMRRYFNGLLSLTPLQGLAADMNGDSTVNSTDLIRLKQYFTENPSANYG